MTCRGRGSSQWGGASTVQTQTQDVVQRAAVIGGGGRGGEAGEAVIQSKQVTERVPLRLGGLGR